MRQLSTRRVPAFRGVFALLILFLISCGAFANTILQNGTVEAEFDAKALVRITDIATNQSIQFSNISSSITVDGTKLDTATLTPTSTNTQADSITYTYVVGARQLKVVYQLKPNWRFVCVRMYLTLASGATSRINSVVSLTGNITNSILNHVRGTDPQADYTGTTFVRFSTGGTTPQENGYGMFALVQNPYVTWARTGQTISMSYTPDMQWKSSYSDFPSDACCIGPYELSGTRFPMNMVPEYLYVTTDPVKNGFDWAEVDAVRQCMRAFLQFNTQKSTRIHILWCEAVHIDNDAATAAGRVAYKRAIDRAKEFGCDYVLYIATNSAVSTNSPLYNADLWQAEYCLWFGMGQKMRQGLWDTLTGPIDVSIQEILDYAESKNVKLISYVYPSMPFKQNPEWLNSSGWTDTGVRSFQDWFVTQLTNFAQNTGAAGYCFDHWWIDMGQSDCTSRYAQFFGCRRMLENARIQMPDAVFDGRQTYCWYGPWSWLAGTYPHPLNDDESAASWKSFPDLHVDRCFAARHRYKWFWHVVDQFAPIELAPGFITHTGSRTEFPDGTAMTHPHDWDYMGWKYNMLSTIGTAPFNLVVNYIPVLSLDEYNAISQADKDWFNYWMDWAESHLEYMRNARPIISQIMIGKVDGSAAFINDHGFIFLYNSNYRKISGDFKLDKSIGLNTGTKFIIKQLEPQAGKLIGKPGTGLWNYGDTVSIPVQGTTAMVFEVLPASSITSPTLLNMEGTASVANGRLQITNAKGEVGAIEDFIVALPSGTTVNSVRVNGRDVAYTRNGDTIIGRVKFNGVKFGMDQQIGTYDSTFKGTTFRGSFRIPQRIMTQLQNRRSSFPVPYTVADLGAAWTAPYRLIMFIHIADAKPNMAVSATIDGTAVTLKKGYNGRYADAGDWMFQGFYLDVSDLQPEVSHQIEVTLPSTLAAGQFQGIFFDTIETEYTTSIAYNQMPSQPLIDMDASQLPLGAVTTWNNTGIVGGSFTNDTTNPVVEFKAGRRCVTFNGSNRMKSTFLSPSTITSNGKYTVAVWAYNPSIGTEECMLTWSHRGGATGTNAQINYGSNTTYGAVNHTNAPSMGFAGGVPTAGKWHHIAITFDGSTERIYVDGILNAEEAKTLSIFNTDSLYLGCAYSGTAPSNYFSGSIGSVQVYDTALPAEDISLLVAGLPNTIAAANYLPENTVVTLTAKPVTYAPRNSANARTTNYFYIEDTNRVAGIRVSDGTTGQDSVTAGTCVTVTGKIKTITATGERYIELDTPAFNEAGSGVKPFIVTARNAEYDSSLPGLLMRIAGTVQEISPDGKWFTITDGSMLDGADIVVKVLVANNFITSSLTTGRKVVVTGVITGEVRQSGDIIRVVAAQSINPL